MTTLTSQPEQAAAPGADAIPYLTAEIIRVNMARQLILGHTPPCFVDVQAARRDHAIAAHATASASEHAAALRAQAAAHLPGLTSELERVREALTIEQRR